MNIKRISAILLVLAVILSFAVSPAIAANNNGIEGAYQDAIDVVTGLHIMDTSSGGSFEPDKSVSRAEMVTVIMRFLGMADMQSEREKILFADVPQTHKAFYDIYAAYDLKIISGGEAFNPDIPVTYEQAVKMMVCALGYSVKAENMGGYPVGYLIVASQNKLLNGINVENTSEMSRKSVARLVYNALDANVYERVTYGDDSKAKMAEGDTAISTYLGYGIISGVVSMNSKTGLQTSESNISENQVVIGSKVFEIGNTDIEKYLGYYVKAYYKTEDNGDETIIMFVFDKNKNNTITLDADVEKKINYSSGNLSIVYYLEGEKKEENVNAVPVACIYNGRSVDHTTMESNIIPSISSIEAGNIILLDNNSDRIYDVLFVNECKSWNVDRVSTMENREAIITTSFTAAGTRIGGVIPLNERGRGIEYNIYNADGKEISLSDIKGNDVVDVYSDLTNTIIDIYVSNKKVAGKITEVSNDDEYTINKTTYKKSKTLPAELLKLGMQTIFYLNRDNRIVGIDKENSISSGQYGYLMGVYVDKNKFKKPQYKILCDDGEIRIFESENKIVAYNPATGNVEKTDVSSLIYTKEDVEVKGPVPYGYGRYKNMLWYEGNEKNFLAEKSYGEANKFFYNRPWITVEAKSNAASRKPVYFETDSENNIRKMIVPDIPVLSENKLSSMNTSNQYGYYYYSTGKMVRDSNKMISLSSDALVLKVTATDYSDKDYTVSTLNFTNKSYYKLQLYSVEGSQNARLVVQSSPISVSPGGMNYVVVDSVNSRIDGSFSIRGFSNGSSYTGIINENTPIIERLLSSDRINYNDSTKVKATNILDFRSLKPDGSKGIKAFDLSVSLNPKVPYKLRTGQVVDGENIKKGDIIFVAKDTSGNINYIEIAMRAEDCVLLPPTDCSSFQSRLMGENHIAKGVVTGNYIDKGHFMRIVGNYASGGRSAVLYPNIYIPDPDIEGTLEEPVDYQLGYFYDDVDMPCDFSGCSNIWCYDYKAETAFLISYQDIVEGDVVMYRGESMRPTECLLLRNYPNEAPYSYWQ